MIDLIAYHSIGTVHSPYHEIVGMPIQPCGARGVAGTIEIDSAYQAGLQDLEGFSHLILIYHLHRSMGGALVVTPFLDKTPHGIFATRSPKRPNPIGFSVVKLVRREGCILHIEDVDILDGTPLLDIKPYVPPFDSISDARIGWMRDIVQNSASVRSDDRFKKPETDQ